SDIAPDRKKDPGELFPWARLAAAGFGLWSDKKGTSDRMLMQHGDVGPFYNSITKQLNIVGYTVANSLIEGMNIEYTLSAFQAHWRPSLVTGCYDEGTALILNDIALQTVQIGKK
ncbi:MAG: N-acetylmuramoyl-L-alanine amidase, partial [Kordiimonadaceae bacterium]|nr:N-acetylmuramoyl-L-alanine amidase [Kordiimonadaceae bacterium]